MVERRSSVCDVKPQAAFTPLTRWQTNYMFRWMQTNQLNDQLTITDRNAVYGKYSWSPVNRILDGSQDSRRARALLRE